ncbi:MAG: FtsX-like permease family protein, partial [Bacteroidota bacterium]
IKINNKHNFTVTGVVADLPNNVTFPFDWLLPFESFGFGQEDVSWMENYASNFAYTFVELAPKANFQQVDAKVRAMIPSKLDAKYNKADTYAFLHSIKDWHLRSEFRDGKVVGGEIAFVRLMLWIAAIILTIACINFINLSTAQSEKRGKEVGVRKVLGSHRKGLVSQFMVEALIIAGLASLLSVFLVMLALPFFNTLVEKQLSLQLYRPMHLASLLGITLVCGLLAGWYPSFYLSSFKPAQILKGIRKKKGGSAYIRKGLVITQFTVSLVFIVATLVVYKQVIHAKSRDMGYNKENLVDISVTGDMIPNFDPIKEALMTSGSIENVALSSKRILESGDNSTGLTWQGATDTEDILIRHRYITPNFFETVGLTLMEGHGFNENSAVDSTNTIITQSFAKLMGEGSPIGKTINRWGSTYNVIGVVSDFRYGNVYEMNNNKPAMFLNRRDGATQMYVRSRPGKTTSLTLAAIEGVLKKYNPAFPFEYQFEDQLFNARFKGLQVLGILANIFSVLAICIACLGIFGLAAFTAEQRTKEIGIRKVLGASISGIVHMLSKDFLKPVLIAMCIAFPLAYWAMLDWLQDFAYRIDMGWSIFALAGFLVLGIALLTASFHAFGAAMANPVKSLRTE